MSLEEESERTLQADDKRQAGDKQNLQKKHRHTKQSQVWRLSDETGWEKCLTNTQCGGITDQLTFPMARRALSKNNIIPKKRKNTPKPVSPMPISVNFKEIMELLLWPFGCITCHTLLLNLKFNFHEETEQLQTLMVYKWKHRLKYWGNLQYYSITGTAKNVFSQFHDEKKK